MMSFTLQHIPRTSGWLGWRRKLKGWRLRLWAWGAQAEPPRFAIIIRRSKLTILATPYLIVPKFIVTRNHYVKPPQIARYIKAYDKHIDVDLVSGFQSSGPSSTYEQQQEGCQEDHYPKARCWKVRYILINFVQSVEKWPCFVPESVGPENYWDQTFTHLPPPEAVFCCHPVPFIHVAHILELTH